MYISAIVLAAGKGVRFSRPNSFTVRVGIPTHISKMIKSGKSNIPKPLVQIDGLPIIIYCLKTLERHPEIKDITVVTNPLNQKAIANKINQCAIAKIKDIVLGGKRRQDSVCCGLKTIGNHADLVLIHDGARPFIDKRILHAVIREAKKCGAAIVGVPVRATIKKVKCQASSLRAKFIVDKTLHRDNLWEIQTPQVFKKDLILEAYRRFGNESVTDDAMLVEKLGVKVSVVLGSYNNIKITTPEDLILAETILKIQKSKCKNQNYISKSKMF